MKITEVYYDKEADFIEVFIGKNSKCYMDEVESGVFVRKDEKTDEVRSIGILAFKKRIEEVKTMNLPVQIDLKVLELA